MDSEVVIEEPASKKGRHRKRQLYNSILQQMEFYFGDSNLSKDRFLSQQIKTDPYVDISIFLKFNKIRRLTTNLDDILKALSKSELLELSEDKTKIRRKTPVQYRENTDECTIYVERIKSDATHEWLASVFSEFGNIVYVSLPKYKQNRVNKGFAFVEFEKQDEAKNALEYFESIGCKMPSNLEPEELCSIETYDEENQKSKLAEKTDESSSQNDDKKDSNKRKLDETDIDSESENKKIAKDSENEDDKLEVKNENSQNEDDKLEEKNENSQNEDDNIEDNEERKKKKKKNKRKSCIKQLGLQILSKEEWKKLRNRYWNTQRTKMKQLKQHLNRIKYSQQSYTENNETSNVSVETEQKTSTPKLEYVPGTIVKIKLIEPCMDGKKLKSEIKSLSSDVQFVDIPLPVSSEEIHVRFSDQTGAQKFCESGFNGKCLILQDDEEKQYWLKIQKDRDVKLRKHEKKQRGRDKLLKKAQKQLNAHIKFEDD